MFKKHYVLMDEAGSEGGAGGGSSSDPGDNNGAAGDDKSQIDPAEFQKLREDFEAANDLIKKLETNNQALLKEKSDAKKAADRAALEAAKQAGDVESIEKSYADKIAMLESSGKEKEQRYEKMIRNLTVGAAASKMASEIAVQGSAEVLMPHIFQRLSVEIRDDVPVTKVLGKDGKPSALTLDDLKEEFVSNKMFAPIIAGTKASGTGYRGGSWSDGDGTRVVTRHEFNSMNPAKQSELSSLMMHGKVKIVDNVA